MGQLLLSCVLGGVMAIPRKEKGEVPWLFKFVRRSMMYWTQLAQTRLSGRIPNLYVSGFATGNAASCAATDVRTKKAGAQLWWRSAY